MANYDFDGTTTANGLSFCKGDRLEILDKHT
ncbi:MAG: SH3 domain-containing protein [Ignavibacteria bacterium]|nr:SH3 domain-containing protein [Ignavibacteria bacterium]